MVPLLKKHKVLQYVGWWFLNPSHEPVQAIKVGVESADYIEINKSNPDVVELGYDRGGRDLFVQKLYKDRRALVRDAYWEAIKNRNDKSVQAAALADEAAVFQKRADMLGSMMFNLGA
jgi:hypothetical protein